jgi:endonuclease/exonuclease/phosphatase family metal-dependent hydrolase
MKRRLLAILLTGLVLAFAYEANAQDKITKEPGYLYLATFNVYKLGAVDGRYKDVDDLDSSIPLRIKNLARVLAVGEFDIVALQEVHSGARGHAVVSDLVRALRENHSLGYHYVLSDYIGQGLIPEAIAFLYNPNRVQLETVNGSAVVAKNISIPGRDMVQTQWEAGHFDFTIVSAHLAWGNHQDRRAGYEKIAQIFDDLTAYSKDPDVIILGDFNRYGDGADAVLALPFDPAKFRAPNVEFFDPAFSARKSVSKSSIANKGVPGDNPQLISTTVAGNKSVYDMIMFSKDVEEEFPSPPAQPKYGIDFGVIQFDEPDGFGFQAGADQLSHNVLKEAYSDHRPLWLRFKMSDSTLADD